MRTAIFGGTFDPIRSAHLEMARHAADQYRLDRVLFIPAGNPPHKRTEVSFEHRYRMVELACAEDPRFVASRLEEGAAKSYSIDTIELVKAACAATSAIAAAPAPNTTPPNAAVPAPNAAAPVPNAAATAPNARALAPDAGAAAPPPENGALFFIIGSDAFAEIQTWHRWEDVIRAVEFIVVARPGHEIAVPPGARVHRLDSVELPVSSSDIRDALARGETPQELPPAIAAYIRAHELYRTVR
jgi:nicotinate-nucleotide adenylyltransferase